MGTFHYVTRSMIHQPTLYGVWILRLFYEEPANGQSQTTHGTRTGYKVIYIYICDVYIYIYIHDHIHVITNLSV